MKGITIKGITVEFTNDNTKIYESYKIKNIKQLMIDIMKKRKELGFVVNRTIDSYVKETKAHNRLYKLGIARSHTRDTDLEEYPDKKTSRIWGIIGR